MWQALTSSIKLDHLTDAEARGWSSLVWWPSLLDELCESGFYRRFFFKILLGQLSYQRSSSPSPPARHSSNGRFTAGHRCLLRNNRLIRSHPPTSALTLWDTSSDCCVTVTVEPSPFTHSPDYYSRIINIYSSAELVISVWLAFQIKDSPLGPWPVI